MYGCIHLNFLMLCIYINLGVLNMINLSNDYAVPYKLTFYLSYFTEIHRFEHYQKIIFCI